MSIELFWEIMNTDVVITNGHLLLLVNLFAILFIHRYLRRKTRNTEIRFNIRELARERELLRQASIAEEENRRLMREHHDAIDQVFAELGETLDDWHPQHNEKIHWQQEGF